MGSVGLSYSLQQRNASQIAFREVASNIEALSYTFSGAGEVEGTWVYRVRGTDPTHGETTDFSPVSAPVVVDRTPPFAPTAAPSRAPDFAGGGGWYKDGVSVSFTSRGDPNLADGSAGSGVNTASLSETETFSTSGSHTASGTVADYAGNVSAAGTLVVQVDATPPTLEIECPAQVNVSEGASATVRASDAQSGLASDPSGTVPIDTLNPGSQTTTRTATDNVGHSTTRSCTTKVVGKPPEFGRCVKAPFEEVGGKKIYKGEFTASSCLVTSSSHTGPYEWKPGVVKKGFHIAITSGTRAMFENAKGVKVFCTGESASFTITGAKTVGNVVIKFTGCEGSFRVCNTPGLGAGEIDTKTLEGVLGIERTTIKEGKETRYAGIDLFPVGRKGPFLEYECEALGKTTLSGSVIGSVLTDKMFTSGTDKHIEKSSIQKPEKFLEGEKDVLSNGLEQVGFSDSVVQSNEEAFEINAYV
jgi:hypothetical protein